MNFKNALNNDNASRWPTRSAPVEPTECMACPPFVKSSRFCEVEFSGSGEKMIQINLSKLPQDKRKPAWDWLKRFMPNLAELIERQELQTVKQRFEGEVLVFMPESALKQLGVKS